MFPTVDHIVLVNSRIVGRYGGAGHQVLNGGPLHYVLDAISGPIFGVDQYPTLEEKACRLAFAIATNHVFLDGNKKTAVSALDLMLELNGKTLQVAQEDLSDLMYGLAQGAVPFEEFVSWVRQRLA